MFSESFFFCCSLGKLKGLWEESRDPVCMSACYFLPKFIGQTQYVVTNYWQEEMELMVASPLMPRLRTDDREHLSNVSHGVSYSTQEFF